jgi:hypothetical protein
MRPQDVPPDAHLLAALRHAPDHGVAPPPGLSARILAQAQQAVMPRPAGPWFQRWRQGLQALDRLLSQPALTGALATVALATVIGFMWRGGAPVDNGPDWAETTFPASVPAASAPAADETRAAVAPAAAPPAARVQPPARALKAPAPPPSPVPTAPMTAPATEPAPAAHLERKRESAPANQAPAAVADSASPAPRPLATVLEALRDQPATVQVLPAPGRSPAAEASRQRLATDESRAARMSPPLTDTAAAGREWLSGVARAAEGRWRPVAGQVVDADGPGEVVVQIGGATAGRLLLTGSGVLWWLGTEPGPAWLADLDAATLQALRAQVPRR